MSMVLEEMAPIAAILGIGTSVPAYQMVQSDISEKLVFALRDYPNSMRWARRIFKQCGVETRYTCEPNLVGSVDECKYLFPSFPLEEIPSTRERMDIYKRESVPLGLEAARKALSDSQTKASEITHLITVSCTGQFLPGIDTILVRELGLSPYVSRIPLQFLGCSAGLRAISLSRQIVLSAPLSKILIVCVELCTLHFQPSVDKEALYGASFFGDGASACLVGSAKPEHSGIFQLGDARTVLLPDCSEVMVWEVGNHGFYLYLSPEIPKLLGKYIPAEIESFLAEEAEPEIWAIHPGGRGIVDTLQDLFMLTDEQTHSSRSILRQYGNLSSATILFVLQDIRNNFKSRDSDPSNGIAAAFGPGLTMELLKIAYV